MLREGHYVFGLRFLGFSPFNHKKFDNIYIFTFGKRKNIKKTIAWFEPKKRSQFSVNQIVCVMKYCARQKISLAVA